MSTLIAIIGLISVLAFCFVVNAITQNFDDLYAPIRRFDVFYYEKIAESGYNHSGIYSQASPEVYGMWNGMSVWAFFPLMPFCVKLLSILTFNLIDSYVLAIMLSTACMGVMLYYLIRFLRLKQVKINYFLIAVLFVFNTYFLFYFNFYTEAMFMMLIAIFLNLCEEKRFLASGIVLAFMTATRVTGVFFIFYLFYKIYQQLEIVGSPKNKFVIFCKKVFCILKNPYYLASLIVSFLGLAAFIIILKCCFNLSPLAFVDAQVGWGKTNTFFAYNIFVGFTTLFSYYNSFFASVFVVLSIGFCFYLIFKQKQYFVPIFMLCYIVFLTSSSVVSADRYIFDMLLLTIEFYKLLVECFAPANIQNKRKKAFGITAVSIVLLFCVVASCLIGATKLVFY